MNEAAVNILIQGFLWTDALASVELILGMELLGHRIVYKIGLTILHSCS